MSGLYTLHTVGGSRDLLWWFCDSPINTKKKTAGPVHCCDELYRVRDVGISSYLVKVYIQNRHGRGAVSGSCCYPHRPDFVRAEGAEENTGR